MYSQDAASSPRNHGERSAVNFITLEMQETKTKADTAILNDTLITNQLEDSYYSVLFCE